jgi:hypothetical protein
MENEAGRALVEAGALCERKNGRGVDPNRNWPVDWGVKEKDYDPPRSSLAAAPSGGRARGEVGGGVWGRGECGGVVARPGAGSAAGAAPAVARRGGQRQRTPAPDGPPFPAPPPPRSEPEAQAVAAVAKGFQPHVWLNVHSGMEALFTPFDHKATVPEGHEAQVALQMLRVLNHDLCRGACVIGSGGKSVGWVGAPAAAAPRLRLLQLPPMLPAAAPSRAFSPPPGPGPARPTRPSPRPGAPPLTPSHPPPPTPAPAPAPRRAATLRTAPPPTTCTRSCACRCP